MKMDQAYRIIHKLKDVIIIHLCLKTEDLHSYQMTPQIRSKNMLKNWVIVSIRLDRRVKIFRSFFVTKSYAGGEIKNWVNKKKLGINALIFRNWWKWVILNE
jgi:hypothetical protein